MRAGMPRLVLLAALIPLLLLAPLPDAGAAEDATKEIDREALVKDRRQKASRNPVSTRVSRYLNAAAEAVDEEDPQEAKRLLNRLDMRGLNRYERVLIYRMLAYVSYGANESAEAIAKTWIGSFEVGFLLPLAGGRALKQVDGTGFRL